MTRVVIADSSPGAANVYGGFFAARGYEVVTATNGLECLDCLDRLQPDVLILDVRLPSGGAERVIAWLEGAQAVQPVPAVVLTGYASARSLPGVMRASPVIEAYFETPVRVSVLEEAVRCAASIGRWRKTIHRPHGAGGEDRPPPRPQEPCVELPLLVPERHWTALEGAAYAQGLNVAQLLRRLIATYLAMPGDAGLVQRNGEGRGSHADPTGHPDGR